jgi:hypothetical protein
MVGGTTTKYECASIYSSKEKENNCNDKNMSPRQRTDSDQGSTRGIGSGAMGVHTAVKDLRRLSLTLLTEVLVK